MAGLSFAAIDVETANSARGSICAVGVTVVRDGVRTASESWLCRPPEGMEFFAWHNIRVHGISAGMVAGQPTFADRWPEVTRLVGELPVIAHNAGFDSGAIREACVRSGIHAPAWEFSCSLALARRHLDLESYRLPNVAAALGIDFTNHHDAGADAAAAAEIVLALATRTGAESLAALDRMAAAPRRRAERAATAMLRADARASGRGGRGRGGSGSSTAPESGAATWPPAADPRSPAADARPLSTEPGSARTAPPPRSVEPRPYGGRATSRVESAPRRTWFGREELVIPEVTGTDPSHPLFGEIVVFTGDLAAMTRQEAWNAIAGCGATPARNVTKRTTRLVIGDGFLGQDPAAFTTTKAQRVAELRMRGQRIEVMDEAAFLACLRSAADRDPPSETT